MPKLSADFGQDIDVVKVVEGVALGVGQAPVQFSEPCVGREAVARRAEGFGRRPRRWRRTSPEGGATGCASFWEFTAADEGDGPGVGRDVQGISEHFRQRIGVAADVAAAVAFERADLLAHCGSR